MPRLRAVLTPDEHLQVFVLESLFPPPHAFVLNNALHTLLHLSMQPGTPHPVLLSEQQFTEQELNLVLPLLTNYPEYAPMEELYASYCYGYDRQNGAAHRPGARPLTRGVRGGGVGSGTACHAPASCRVPASNCAISGWTQ